MLFAFICTAAYGGTLRAYMLHPEFTRPISTMEDIVKSGLTWKMVLYGDEIETIVKNRNDDISRTFWEQKEVVGYNEYPVDTVRL